MVKVYYSYEHASTTGQYISKSCNFAMHAIKKLIITGVNQYIVVISMKTGQILKYIWKKGKNVPVRFIKISSSKIYAGYEDGSISIWEMDWEEVNHEQESASLDLDLHKSSISWISVNEDETKMISGGMDGQIMIWDLLSEESFQIKSAHHNAITQVEYTNVLFKGKLTPIVMSTGKDGFFKLWNMDTLLCLSAISTHATEALSFQYDSIKNLIYVGTNKEDIVLIKIHQNAESVMTLTQMVGIFKRKNYSKCQQMLIQYNTMYILNSDKKIEVYELLSESKLKLKRKRLVSRKKSKKEQSSLDKIEEQAKIDHNKEQTNINVEGEELQFNEYVAQISFVEQKTLLYKVYNMCLSNSNNKIIYLNDGANIIEFTNEHQKQLTKSIHSTLQLELSYPFLIQRNHNNLQVYNYGHKFQHLFSISKKALYCSLFNSGYLLIVEKERVVIWDLAKNQQIYSLEEKWSGCLVRKNKCMLWRDNQIGFYDVGADSKGKAKMKLVNSKQFEDKIINALYKHSMEMYFVNLQNSQIHIQYADTHKNFLKLYGHKLPINSFDISSDDSLLVSGSTDKDIRFWDMDFGHSIKTLFAHSEAVTVVKFIHETHYVLSGSKDGHVKFWDADTHQLIMDFEENTMEVKGIVVTNAGDYIIAGGNDGGFRVWKQTNDQTIASDQEEKKMDKIMIEEYASEKFKSRDIKTRYEDLKHGEQVIEALENAEQPSLLLKLLKKIPAANLHSTLSFLHAHHVKKLESYLKYLISLNHETQLSWRVIEALGQGSKLSEQLRQKWKQQSKILRINKESFRLMLKSLKEERSLWE